MTKPFTAAAVLHLAERGELALDEPITAYLPEYPTQGRHVTVHHLLNHTSGIRRFLDVDPELHVNREFRMNLSYEEMLELFAEEPFGTQHDAITKPGELLHQGRPLDSIA